MNKDFKSKFNYSKYGKYNDEYLEKLSKDIVENVYISVLERQIKEINERNLLFPKHITVKPSKIVIKEMQEEINKIKFKRKINNF
jgi:hypothetical protein